MDYVAQQLSNPQFNILHKQIAPPSGCRYFRPMPSAYQIDKQEGVYFMTFTTVGWVDLFIRDTYKQLLCDSLNYCVDEFGLRVHVYVIMPSHMHLIASAEHCNLSKVVGSFKKFTSRELIDMIKKYPESRREWMLPIFREAGERNPRNKNYQVWQQKNHAEEVYSPKFILSKVKYIRNNPVEAGFVARPEEYLYSSARDYAGMKGPVKLSMIELHMLF